MSANAHPARDLIGQHGLTAHYDSLTGRRTVIGPLHPDDPVTNCAPGLGTLAGGGQNDRASIHLL